jgi:hypothetical protein
MNEIAPIFMPASIIVDAWILLDAIAVPFYQNSFACLWVAMSWTQTRHSFSELVPFNLQGVIDNMYKSAK